jgi:hypothetical protein
MPQYSSWGRSLVVVAGLFCAMPWMPPPRRFPVPSGRAVNLSGDEIRWEFNTGG